MIDPKVELFIWGPIDGRPVYTDLFNNAFVGYPKFIGFSWPDLIGYYKNDTVMFIADYEKLRDNGEQLFKKFVLKPKTLKKKFKEWQDCLLIMKDYERLVNQGLKSYSDNDIKNMFQSWYDYYINFWHRGFLPELANWGGERLLKNRILKQHPEQLMQFLEVLSAPNKLSFFQKEELDFLKLKLIKDKKILAKKLHQHAEKYYWLHNNYAFIKVLDVNYFSKELNKIALSQAKKKIKRIESYSQEIKGKKKDLIKKYQIDQTTVQIAAGVAFCVWWQDLRKKYIFIANQIITEFVKEISKRKHLGFKELCYYTSNEVINLLKYNKKVNSKSRYIGLAGYYHEKGNLTFYPQQATTKLIKPYLEIKIDKTLKEFSGLVVSQGKQSIVKGQVRILLTPRNLSKMKQGDILVAPMTSPDFVIAMRKARAIITDTGGMTSHAAIISRELNIPCIVGTKIATQVLQDGDRVEVDANHGIIKIL